MQIVLSGYYGFDNAGDEALLAAIVSSIKDLAPEAAFVVLSGHPEKTSQLHPVQSVHYMRPGAVMRALRQSDLLISGGGSIFQDVTSLRSLLYYISVVAMALWFKKPVIFYAQGIGPINHRISRWLMKKLANRVDFISLRDEESLKELKKLGITRPPCQVTADPVFALQPHQTAIDNMSDLLQQLNPNRQPMLGVSVRSWAALADVPQILAPVLDRLHSDGYHIIFLPLAYPEDVAAAQKVMARMKTPTSLINRNLSSQEYLAVMRSLEAVIGMRLHALVFAANQGIPFAGISYDPKIDAFLKLFSLEALPREPQGMYEAVCSLLHDQAQRMRIKEKSVRLHEKSEQNARLALSLIEARSQQHEG